MCSVDATRTVGNAIATLCNYICSDSNYSKFIDCKRRCVEWFSKKIKEWRWVKKPF